MKLTRRRVIASIGALGFGGSGAIFTLVNWKDRPGGEPGPAGAPVPGGPFSLTDQFGRAVTDQDYRGKFMLVFFGYTMCPDICPTTLLDMTKVMEMLGDIADRVQPLFVSVDPERDNANVLKDYLSAFDPRIVGLTGTPDEIRRVAKAYRAYYAKFMTGEGGYTVDHSAYIYLMGPDGGYLTHFAYPASSATVAKDIRDFVTHPRVSRLR
jgi:protein SCO1/2